MVDKVTELTWLGEEWAAKRMIGNENLDPSDQQNDGSWVGWGSGTNVANKADTDLFLEETEDRVHGDVSFGGGGITAKYQVEATLVADDTKVITETATFTANALGTIILHSTFEGIALGPTDEVTFTFSIDPS